MHWKIHSLLKLMDYLQGHAFGVNKKDRPLDDLFVTHIINGQSNIGYSACLIAYPSY